MKKVYITSSNAITSLGFDPEENAAAMEKSISGIKSYDNDPVSVGPFIGSRVDSKRLDGYFLQGSTDYTRFEKLVIASVSSALKADISLASAKRTVFILSTTKGNIDHIGSGKRIKLSDAANAVVSYFKNPNKPLIVCNACISGSVAILLGKRLIEAGEYDHAVVCGADVFSEFVLTGFQCFKALSANPCKPFDSGRDGLTLGEGAGTVILSIAPSASGKVVVAGGGISNDANHISGPSRTGDGLYSAIKQALQDAKEIINPGELGYISGHGTGTMYNDEMESKAINLAGLQDVPLNSLKGFVGHTLGAAGLVETAMGVYSLNNNKLFPSAGFTSLGVSQPVNVLQNSMEIEFKGFLKTASGFGGCNAALIISQK